MHLQTQEEWEIEMSEKILALLRDEIYLELRFLKPALSALEPEADKRLKTFATDGICLYYSTEQLIRVFQSNGRFLDRAYLHTILHCIFSHLWIAGKRDRRRWNLACDIVTEYTIDKLDKPCTRRILSWNRQQIYQRIEDAQEGISAAVVYRQLGTLDEEWIRELEQEFYTDDHCYWANEKEDSAKQQVAKRVQENWNKIARQTRMEQQIRGDETEDGGELFAAQIKAGRGRRSYRDFLKQFSFLREELKLDPEEFDLNYYSYGLRLYGNLPLVEPLESKEDYRIQEFIMAIDTSYSTSGELVENFLKETFDILMERSRFSGKSKIRIIQCDNQIRQDVEVRSLEELTYLLEHFHVTGGGGTDFRPVFNYVNEKIKCGEMKTPEGLLYFTDGKGIYPKKRPDYKTAFLFIKEFEEEAVPPWAMRVKLEPEEFEGEH